MTTKIVQVDLMEQTRKDMIKYALYSNRTRVVPNVLDGLKVIHRRILYGAYQFEHATSEKNNVKSSKLVGSVMGRLHPHGDTAIYDSMKPMANDFEINMPLLLGTGNWGSRAGDGAAAARYTEVALSNFAVDTIIDELKNEPHVVDWYEAYTGKENEPEYLPTKLPLLLINGCFGIGTGVKVFIPKHPLGEVVDATLTLIENPNADIVLIPDQADACDIIESDFKSISNKGHGKFIVRGHIELVNALPAKFCKDKGKPALVIRSLPDLTFLNTVKENIEALVEQKKLPQIINILNDDEPDRLGCVLVLKPGSDPNYVKDVLYKNKIGIQKPFTVNFEVLDGLELIRMSYKSYLLSFIERRKITKFRFYTNQLQKIRTKLHEKEAFVKVMQSGYMDTIDEMIKTQRTIDDNYLIEYIITNCNVTDLQASYILNSKSKERSLGYLEKYIAEAESLQQSINCYMNIIMSDTYIIDEIKQELIQLKEKYPNPRKCKIISQSELNNIPEGEFKIIVTENNFIKKVGANDSLGSFKNDRPKSILNVENTQNILLFDEMGKVFKLPVHKIPLSDKNSNGCDVRLLIKKLTSNINAVMYEPRLLELSKNRHKYFLTVLTKNNLIKKLDLEDFLAVSPSGILYIKMDNNDIVKDIKIIGDGLDAICYSKNKALRMNISEIPHQGRNTKGMKALGNDIEADGISIIKPDTTDIIVITESGRINRFDVVALPSLGRAKTASKVIKLGKTDSIKTIFGCNYQDILKVRTKNEKLEFNIQDLPVGSSISTGTKVIPLKNGDIIVKCDIKKNRA